MTVIHAHQFSQRRHVADMTDREIAIEALERTRRMETRLTKYMQTQGFDTQGTRARYLPQGVIDAPSKDITLRELLSTVPADKRGSIVKVMVGDKVVMAVYAYDDGVR